jgi:hypothetical protein
MKPLIIFIVLCFVGFNQQGFAQIKKDSLVGQWKLVELIGKQISEGELQKRYRFTADTFYYTSRKKNLTGSYTLKPATGQLTWVISGLDAPMFLIIKQLPDGRMEMSNEKTDEAMGILEKIRGAK